MTCLIVGCKQKEDINWHHLDLAEDGVFGVSTNKAYKELLKGKEGEAVIVAVMDSGFDVDHKSLKSKFWTNKREIKNNGIDDDNNGFIDDINGWNFTGSVEGSGIKYFSKSALASLVQMGQTKFGEKKFVDVPISEREEFLEFQKRSRKLINYVESTKTNLTQVKYRKQALDRIIESIGKENPTLKDFVNYKPSNDRENQARSKMISLLRSKTFKESYQEDFVEELISLRNSLDYWYNVDYLPFTVANSSSSNSSALGNNLIKGLFDPSYGESSTHGTHVAGIIAAEHNPENGVRGIAENVQIMGLLPLAADPLEQEHAIAKSIRYAVDHGAKIINMSFGESYTIDQTLIEEAMKYAADHDVLLVHASGNHGVNLDTLVIYPRPYNKGVRNADNWINVGASDKSNDEYLKASFSNFSKEQVDVFAPGVRINSTIPGSEYKRHDGTSMAAPIVSGIAALIRSYYPTLTAVQVKEIIMKSVVKADQLKDRCISGGVVNAYNALKLADTYSKK
ncbi:S8 family serine peptidase [Sphingobacterium faecale]|uniref:S8 family serine peptidase n=1 Tax=Sphingobacterium faecale TaxID=2803775 RepID=A0ABS1R0M6_9SPHI|nr:S8 family serine peptidase [Sphingobacterium faecale]MBL1408246.1 S8 family serine peptidase [Sphingobacterium faecale]